MLNYKILIFFEANLKNAQLQNANLYRAKFYQANLKGADFSGAKLSSLTLPDKCTDDNLMDIYNSCINQSDKKDLKNILIGKGILPADLAR